MKMNYSVFVGIDVAQMKHDFCVLDKDGNRLLKKKKLSFDNTLPGYQKFIETVTSFTEDKNQIQFGMEVTGIYGDNLYQRLVQDGYNVIMILPESVKKYRDYKGLPKTDRLDAKCITEILVRGEAQSAKPQKKEYAELKSLTRRRTSLKSTLVQEKNRFLARINVYFPDLLVVFKSGYTTMKAIFSSYSTPYSIINADKDELLDIIQTASKNRYGVEKMNELIEAANHSIAVTASVSEEDRFQINSILDSIDFLENQLHELDRLIENKANTFPAYQILLTFTGCGKHTAATLIAELGDLSRFHKASQIVAFAGLHGNNDESGSSVNKRGKLTKHGSRELRHALYLIAEFARRYNPILKDYFVRKKNGDRKKHILAVNAVANKICTILFSIMRNESIYVIKYRDLAKLSEVTQNEFFQNVETDFSANVRKKKYYYEDQLGEIHEFVFKNTKQVVIE